MTDRRAPLLGALVVVIAVLFVVGSVAVGVNYFNGRIDAAARANDPVIAVLAAGYEQLRLDREAVTGVTVPSADALVTAVVGEPGLQGQPGLQGLPGIPGLPGAIGPIGPLGPQGPAGGAGVAGTQGNPGAQGAAGAGGLSGPQGPAGPTGPQGEPGATGSQGPPGQSCPAGSHFEQRMVPAPVVPEPMQVCVPDQP